MRMHNRFRAGFVSTVPQLVLILIVLGMQLSGFAAPTDQFAGPPYDYVSSGNYVDAETSQGFESECKYFGHQDCSFCGGCNAYISSNDRYPNYKHDPKNSFSMVTSPPFQPPGKTERPPRV